MISRSLQQRCRQRPFVGRPLSRHEGAANWVAHSGLVVSLTTSAVGMGPFSLQIRAASWPPHGSELVLDGSGLQLDGQRYPLAEAAVWEPLLVWPAGAREKLMPYLLSYASRPAASGQETGFTMALRRRGHALQEAYRQREDLGPAAAALIGLGNGLTPAGDDYLLGFLIATRLSHSELIINSNHLRLHKTTLLSQQFLRAALRGEFSQPWHELAQALQTGGQAGISQAVRRIAALGASSGRDALAGLADTLLPF